MLDVRCSCRDPGKCYFTHIGDSEWKAGAHNRDCDRVQSECRTVEHVLTLRIGLQLVSKVEAF